LTLGPYPAFSLAQARKKRDEARAALASGKDPARWLGVAHDVVTVSELAKSWRENVLRSRHKDGGAKVFRAIEYDLLGEIGNQALTTVNQDQLIRILERKARTAPTRAAKALSWWRRMFSYAVRRQLIKSNPLGELLASDVGAGEKARKRNLSWDELKELADKIKQAQLSPRIEAALWLLLATGCRTGELRTACKSHIDLTAREWRIPETKNGSPHLVHLSSFAAEQFAILFKYSSAEWVLEGDREGRPVSEEFLRKMIGERISTVRRAKSTRHVGTLRLSGGTWRLHDLRRTMASRMGDLGIAPHIIEACLNHVRKGLEGVYQRQELMRERRQAFQRWGAKLAAIHKRAYFEGSWSSKSCSELAGSVRAPTPNNR
jgi:integrase